MEEHRASMQDYYKVHKETVRSQLRMAIVQQNLEMDIHDIKQVLAQRREQTDIRAYRMEEDQRREEVNQKIEELKNLIQSFIQNPISAVKMSQPVTKAPCYDDFAAREKKKVVEETTFQEMNKESKTAELHITMVTKTMDEEKSKESYTSSGEVKKEVKDNGDKGVHVTDSEVVDRYGGENLPQTDNILEDLNGKYTGTCIGVLQLVNNQDIRKTTWADLEVRVGFDVRVFEGLHCDLGRGQKSRTWNPGINIFQSNTLRTRCF